MESCGSHPSQTGTSPNALVARGRRWSIPSRSIFAPTNASTAARAVLECMKSAQHRLKKRSRVDRRPSTAKMFEVKTRNGSRVMPKNGRNGIHCEDDVSRLDDQQHEQ